MASLKLLSYTCICSDPYHPYLKSTIVLSDWSGQEMVLGMVVTPIIFYDNIVNQIFPLRLSE